MSDQHVITDWKAHFAAYMARWTPYVGPPTVPYEGWGTFRIVWVGTNHGAGVDVTAPADQVVTSDGSEVVVTAN